MKPLIAIVNCHMLRERQQAIRETWLPSIVEAGFDYRFFLGRAIDADPEPKLDEVFLDVDDSYRGLPAKTKAICEWSIRNGYGAKPLFKCDDDTYVQGGRLMRSEFAQLGDYIGRKRGPSGGFPAPYASGFATWYSPHAQVILVNEPLGIDPAEDRWAGNALLRAGIQCVADYRYAIIDSRRNALSHFEGPRAGNTIIAAAEFGPEKMRNVHMEWLNLRTGMRPVNFPSIVDSPFEKVCVLVKTFLRDGYLVRTVESIQRSMPAAKIVIVDDGYESSFKISWYASLRSQHPEHVCVWLPFDSGFGAKSNEGVKWCNRPYVLIASDDFEFTDTVKDGVADMICVLEADASISVVSGRVNGQEYEATLEVQGADCYERRGYRETRHLKEDLEYRVTDLTVNFSLVRREVFETIQWDEDVKIGGGEHGAFFLDLKRAGFVVASLPSANVNELRGSTDWRNDQYALFRKRARQPGRPCLKRRGIERYHLMGGGFETT